MEKWVRQGPVFFYASRASVYGSAMAAYKKIVAYNPWRTHFEMDNRTYEKVTQRTIGAEFEQIIRGVKLTPLHELLSYI